MLRFSSGCSVAPSATTAAAGPGKIWIIPQPEISFDLINHDQALTPESAFSSPTAMMECMMSQHSWTAMSTSVASALLKACTLKRLC